MEWQQQMPVPALDGAAEVILLEAGAGAARRAALRRWLEEARARGAATWLAPCDFEEKGVWAGVREVLDDLMPRLEADAPHLILRHSYELTIVLPHLRGKLPTRHPLTETSPVQERVRNYPIDRAYRIVHGIVDLLAEWHRLSGGGPWVIACEDYDGASAMVRRFFAELMRRRGERLKLTLLLAVAPGAGEAAADQFEAGRVVRAARLDFPPDPPAPIDAEELSRLALEIEERLKREIAEAEVLLPQLIRYWSLAGQPERASKMQALALGIHNHQGFYEDALRYCEPVRANLEALSVNEEIRWNLVGNIFGCYVALGDMARAYGVVVDEALSKIQDPRQKVKVCYVMGMLYARYLPDLDLEKASSYLEKGLKDIPGAGLLPDDRYFYTAFMMNGLALVRHRQKRPAEAVELCRSASRLLNEHLHPDQHRLHRSVLLYNIAQIYSFTGPFEEAIRYYSGAIEMDPNYSEYYNERGSVHLKLGDLDSALSDYLKAIELSPPYPEVLTNLGQCYGLMGRAEEAVEAYSTSLDLVPHRGLSLTGRAQAYEALGQLDAALADYTAALALDPNQPLLLANRAVIHYEKGDLPLALEDLNRAVALSPENAELYRNRAVALTDLGRPAEAAADLQLYLRSNPSPEDRAEVEGMLSQLRVSASV